MARPWKTLSGVYDAALLAVSPRRAQIRKHMQMMENDLGYRETFFAGMRALGYRAAGVAGSKTPWQAATASADREILYDLPNLRNRSRELNRDDSLASGLTSTFVNNIVGTGIRPQARTTDAEKNDRIEAFWAQRQNALYPGDGLSHSEAQRLRMRKMFEDGEIFRNTVHRADGPVCFENIEADRVMTPSEHCLNPLIRQGIERDASGRIVAYWICKNHPGDVIGAPVLRTADFIRVVAENVMHLKVAERPGQSRGVPLYHAVLQDLRDLDLLMVASLKRVQIAACLAVFIKSVSNGTDLLDLTAMKYGARLDQPIEPGMIFKLYPDEDISTLLPNFPTPELVPFVIMIARRIAAAVGVSWQVVLRDYSSSSWSSARTDVLDTRRTFKIYQFLMIEKDLQPEWRVVLNDGILSGHPLLAGVTPEDVEMCSWIPPGWEWVDPRNEAAAKQIELEIGSTTLQEICAEQGKDWQEVARQRLDEELFDKTERAARGLDQKLPKAKPGEEQPPPEDGEDSSPKKGKPDEE